MSDYKLKKGENKSRIIAAAAVVAVVILGGAFMSTDGVTAVWLLAALYMLGPLAAAVLVRPLQNDGWLFITATILSLGIVLPWSFINPAQWATVYLPELGFWANLLFLILLITSVGAGQPPRKLCWALTGFYLLILLALPLVL
ncbi:MAG TPA: hypothetical protein PLD25_20210 [Chloroflexota bacterium]|nr:hypothetical protein [Chloroflexota bacterium]